RHALSHPSPLCLHVALPISLATQKRRFLKAVDIVGHLGVKTGTGDGQGAAAVALNGVQGELRAVPEVFRIAEQRDHISEIFQKIDRKSTCLNSSHVSNSYAV